jgi:hypothetical protein
MIFKTSIFPYRFLLKQESKKRRNAHGMCGNIMEPLSEKEK